MIVLTIVGWAKARASRRAHHSGYHNKQDGGLASLSPPYDIKPLSGLRVPFDYFFGDFENQAGRGGVREQAALGIGDARFRGRRAAADAERAAFRLHRTGILGHALDEGEMDS